MNGRITLTGHCSFTILLSRDDGDLTYNIPRYSASNLY